MEFDNKILDKYGLPTFEQYKANMQDGETEAGYYIDFLRITDYVSNKIIEQFISDISGATAKTLTDIIINFVESVEDEYKTILEYRAYSRRQV